MTQLELEWRVRVLHERWLPVLGLQNWDDESYVSMDDGGNEYAEVQLAQWEYERLKVAYFHCWMAPLNNRKIEDIVVHELTHALYQPLRDVLAEMIEELDDDAQNIVDKLADGHEERVTTQVSKALIRAYGYLDWSALTSSAP